jgi:hypothetical protein
MPLASFRLVNGQGCSMLKDSDIIEDVIKAHTFVKESKTDIFDLVFTQNVEGRTSQLGGDMGINPNTRFIFAHGHVTDMMIAILNVPMMANGVTKLLSPQNDG